MKAIINGVRYDTEKAILIGGGGSDCNTSRSDFGYWTAELYVTKRSRRFFLAGSGGAMSRFAQSYGQNGWQGGSGIQPLDPEDALTFAERHIDQESIEEHFADMIVDA